jgi:hypothetical protein
MRQSRATFPCSMAGTRRPPPNRFLTDPGTFASGASQWIPQEGLDACEVATAFLLERIAEEVRRSLKAGLVNWKDLSDGESAGSISTLKSKVAGKIPFDLEDVVRWALLAGPEVLPERPPDIGAMFPPSFRTWLNRRGPHLMPLLRAPTGLRSLESDVQSICNTIANYLSEQWKVGQHPTRGEVAGQVARTLVTLVARPEWLDLEPPDMPGVDVALNSPPSATISLILFPEVAVADRTRWPPRVAQAIALFHDAAMLDVGERIVLVSGPTNAADRFEDYVNTPGAGRPLEFTTEAYEVARSTAMSSRSLPSSAETVEFSAGPAARTTTAACLAYLVAKVRQR